MAKQSKQQESDDAGIGASDGYSGGGPGANTPDGELLGRIGDPAAGADVAQDRARLFPNARQNEGGRSSDVKTKDQSAPNGT